MEFRDLKSQYKRYKNEINEGIQQVLDTSRFIGGDVVTELEERLAAYIGVNHCITCANGTEAMTLLLMAWDIGDGDAVFVPNFTFFSTGEVVSFRNATPVFVDINPVTFNMDANKLGEAIVQVLDQGQLVPKAVIPVDLFGLPAEHTAIQSVADQYNLKVIEDGAQGFGGSINRKMACSFGDASTTSFFPAKPLGCYGDGGAIFTNDDELASLLLSLKVHGKGTNKYDNIHIGVNSRLDSIQAAILHIKLDAFKNHELEDVNTVAKVYGDLLKGIVETPGIPEGYKSSYAQYTIKLKSRAQRDGLKDALQTVGIPSMIYYLKPMHQQEAFNGLTHNEEALTISTDLCNKVLSLPMHPYLTEVEIQKVVTTIVNYLEETGRK